MCTGGPVWGCLCVCGRKRGMEDKGGGEKLGGRVGIDPVSR